MNLVLFAESCETTMKRGVKDDDAEALKTQFFHFLDDLLEEAKKDIGPKKNDELTKSLREWLDDDMNFMPFSVGVNTLYHLADLHKCEGGEGADKLIKFLDEIRGAERLKKFVVERASDMIKRGAEETVRPLVSNRATVIAKKLFLSR